MLTQVAVLRSAASFAPLRLGGDRSRPDLAAGATGAAPWQASLRAQPEPPPAPARKIASRSPRIRQRPVDQRLKSVCAVSLQGSRQQTGACERRAQQTGACKVRGAVSLQGSRRQTGACEMRGSKPEPARFAPTNRSLRGARQQTGARKVRASKPEP